ncbi:uncharacterized protein sycp2 [Aulostomus maculatus]
MATLQDTQLEKVIDRALKSRSIEALDTFLQRNINERTLIKCSQHFLDKLDKLVNRSLDQKDYKSASLCLAIIYKCGKNLKVPGYGEGLSGIIAQGLIRKIKWFEKCRQLWIQGGTRWNETLFNLSEEFFDALMMVHEACKEGTYEITESFLYPLGQLALDARIHILIQKEAIRKFNIILDKMPVELKKERKILRSQEASDIMIRLAGQVLEGGDYDLQTALMEALCRMATPVQRKDQSDHWFSMEHVASAFVKIRDSDFETDCRRFLNLVNGMQGDKRRVYSFPCLEVYLDKHELLMPADEKLEAFWMDFNLGSHSISFYFSLADEEAQSQWETMCINENEVQSYSVTEKGKRQVLQLNLSEVVSVGSVEGSSLSIYFSSSLDILQTTCSVYGHRKNKGFVGKTSTSVVKTTVKIVMEENGSQMGTPAKMRISESTTFISSSAGGSLHEINPLPADTSTKRKEKPSLEMLRSVDRQSEVSQGALRTADKNCHHHTRPSSMKGQSTAAEQPFKNKPTKHKKEKRHVKKHLFSDTDTDNAMTDASWLRGSNKKPSITKYSRQPPIKPKAASSYKAPDSTIRSPKLAKENSRPNKKLPVLKNTGEQSNKAVKSTAAPDRPKAAARRPQRAAATTTKSYRDPDSDDSQSEPQEPPPTKLFEHLCLFWTHTAVERSAPTLGLTCSPLLTPRGSPLPASPDPPCRDTLSPILLQPKPHSTVSSKGDLKPSSFYNGKKENKCSKAKAQSIQSPHSLSSLTRTGPPITPGSPIGPSATEQCLFSAPQSPLSLSSHPLLTSTLLELDKPCMPSPPQSPFPDVTVGYDCHYGLTEVSPVSQVSLNQSSAKSSSVSSPCRKRHLSLSSNSEDDEKKESKIRMARPLRMKPRRLFKSFGEASADGEMSQVMSSSITVSSGHWEAEGADADMDMEDELDLPDASVNPGNLCQQLSSNLKKKIQSRYKMMEVYNKQSFKTIQQHVSALKMQVTKYRTQDLEQTQRVLLEEIQKVEQEEIVLKNMEKNLSIYWKKLATSFHSYREPQKWRIETLKNALENNMCHSLDCEERIFTSQMCLIRKDMKSVQDRLLSEMQEGEIKSVKRGLHALFFPNGAGI